MQRSSMPVVLLADANVRRRSSLRQFINDRAVTIDCNRVAEIAAKSKAVDPDVVVVGQLTDGGDSLLDVLGCLRPDLISTVVLIADHSSEDLAIGALRAGVRHYFRNSSGLDEIGQTVLKLLPRRKADSDFDRIVGDSRAMRRVKELIRCFGKTEATVLITGETGTGKDLVASSIHQHSSRASGPMITVNCAAIPDALVESELFGFERGHSPEL